MGSVGVHALIAALLVAIATRPRPRVATSAPMVELEAPSVVRDAEPRVASTSGGGAAARGRISDSAARKGSDPAESAGRSRPVFGQRPARDADGDPRGAVRFERDDGVDAGSSGAVGGQGGSGGGEGRGQGRGIGRGIGLGDGAQIAAPREVIATPSAPAASKARPARLVFPSRQREADDAELFVARVTVDHEGFVVGARLVRGFGGPRDSQAADLIWQFRYEPAWDDDGRPIRSTLDQRFLVGR